MFDSYKHKVELFIFRKKWRKMNSHNMVVPIAIFDVSKVAVGVGSYGPIDVKEWGAKNEFLRIGNYCSIAAGVKFLLGGNHEFQSLTSYPIKSKYFPEPGYIEASSKGPIIIEDDVWIGTDAIILSGITIGKGSVIAAGAVVVKDIEPYSIVGGNPGKLIKKRFNDTIINKLIQVDLSMVNFKALKPADLELVQRKIETIEDAECVISLMNSYKLN